MNKLLRNLSLASFIVAILLVAPVANADTNTNIVEQCGNVQVEIKGFGAGLMYQPRPIAIAGERLSAVNISEGCAVVSWVTDMPATSQVIFAEADEVINMDATKENLGFVKATPQNNSAYVVHNAILKGLTPGKAYIYRVVSRSHPSAIPSVSEPYILIVPEAITLPGPISVAPIAWVPPSTTSTTVPAVVEVESTTTITTDLLYQDSTEEVAATSATTSSILNNVPAAITAAVDIDKGAKKDGGGSFWLRLKQAFSFFGGSSVATESQLAAAPTEETVSKEGTVIDASGLVARAGFLIPTLFILLFIFLIQQIALPMIGIIVERPLVFWMFSVIVVAIAAGLLKYYKITLVMIAVFLALLAWYLLSEAEGEVGDKVEKATENKDPQQKTLVKTT